MTVKVPIKGSEWENSLNKAIDILKENNSFLFGGDIDPDSVGSMLSLSLYLSSIGKRVGLLISETLGDNLDYFRKIIEYNQIEVIRNAEHIKNVSDSFEVLIFCDTANTKLVPFYSELSQHILPNADKVIEIDHHFGADSEQILDHSVHLFREANANTEIIGELLTLFKKENPEMPNPFERRNILLALITGLLSDTVGGKVVHFKQEYESWFNSWSDALGKNTRLALSTDSKGGSNGKKFQNPAEILQALDQLSPEQEQCIEQLEKLIGIERGLGTLNLLNSTYEKVKDYSRPFDSSWFSELTLNLVNLVPEKSEKIGAIFFEGKNAEGKDCLFLKLRRAVSYSGFDLRQTEDLITKTFSEHYMGGGGHQGAVSFRFHRHPEKEFLKKFEIIAEFIKENLK